MQCLIGNIWNIGSPASTFTLEGHAQGVNGVDYFVCGNKTFLLGDSDDYTKVGKHISRSFPSMHTSNSTFRNIYLMEVACMGLSNQKLCADARMSCEQCYSSLFSSRASHNKYSF